MCCFTLGLHSWKSYHLWVLNTVNCQYYIKEVLELFILLVHCDSIITRSLRGSQMFFQNTRCESVSRRSRYTQCKLGKSYSLCFSSLVWHQLIFPRGGVNGSLDIQFLRNRGSCVIKRRLSNFCLQNKTVAAHGKRENDD